ncbi:sulfatase-like hydrolase/transferase [Burkholderia anthina]|uniref:sulfatase-like hydrolase/transferase n=1 Tax=Burkholderia anthina TaxID=179879 RepID=UPI00272AB292
MYSAAHEAPIGKIEFDDATVRRRQDDYLNCICDCGRHVECLLDELDDLGIADKTIVVMTSDHGDLAGHHQMIDKGANAYRQHACLTPRKADIGQRMCTLPPTPATAAWRVMRAPPRVTPDSVRRARSSSRRRPAATRR